MGSFKQYVLMTESGLTVGRHNDGPGGPFQSGGGGYIDGVWSGQETPDTHGLSGHPPYLSGTRVFVPVTVKEGWITSIDYRQTTQNISNRPSSIGIYIDGIPTVYVTRDELDRIRKRNNMEGQDWNSLVGKRAKIVFLRRPDDRTETMSQVQDFLVY